MVVLSVSQIFLNSLCKISNGIEDRLEKFKCGGRAGAEVNPKLTALGLGIIGDFLTMLDEDGAGFTSAGGSLPLNN